jgi:hypothetical protein
MADAVLIPCLKQLFAEFNRIAPARDRTSDGWIGDAAHQGTSSDHNPDETGNVPIRDADKINEVHAVDVDVDLNMWLTMEDVVQFLLGRCRAGTEKRLRYMIYNRRIWSASSGWAQQPYTGASPHTEHAHFSASYDTVHESNTSSWHLEDLVRLEQADIDKIAKLAAEKVWATITDRVAPKPGQSPDVTMGAIIQWSEPNLEAAADRIIDSVVTALSDPPPPAK